MTSSIYVPIFCWIVASVLLLVIFVMGGQAKSAGVIHWQVNIAGH